jgi:hypothetical protein
MKTALCLSGLVRNYEIYSDKWLTFIKHWNADVFIHTWDLLDQQNRTPIPNLTFQKLRVIYQPKKFDHDMLERQEEMFERYQKWDFKKEHWHSKNGANFACMFYSIWRSNKLKNEFEIESNQKYDIVVRARFDFGFNELLKPSDIDQNKLNLLPINRNDGYADIFAISNSAIMDVYADVYKNLDECYDNIRLMRPEDALKYWIDKNKIDINIINKTYLIK